MWTYGILFFFNFLNFKIFNSYKRSQTWTPLPPPSPQHLSGSSPCTCPKQAAPYVRHGLAIQFLHDSIHVRIPILPNHPTLSLSLWVQKSVIHICVFFPVLPNESALRIRWPNYWIFSFSIISSKVYSGLISFKTDWFDEEGIPQRLTYCLTLFS